MAGDTAADADATVTPAAGGAGGAGASIAAPPERAPRRTSQVRAVVGGRSYREQQVDETGATLGVGPGQEEVAMVLEELALPTGVSATLLIDQDGRYAVDIADATLGHTTVSGFACELDARTFLYLGDFDDCRDNAAYLTAGLTGLRWS